MYPQNIKAEDNTKLMDEDTIIELIDSNRKNKTTFNHKFSYGYDNHKKIFLPMKSKYEGLYPTLKVTDNDYEMLNDFYLQIRREGIKLEIKDLDDLGKIVSSSGGIRITEEFLERIANLLEDFTKKVVVILGTASEEKTVTW